MELMYFWAKSSQRDSLGTCLMSMFVSWKVMPFLCSFVVSFVKEYSTFPRDSDLV
jgi:hypothetical protein